MNITFLGTPASQNPRYVGGKAAQLGRLSARHPVPPGFCITAQNWSSPGLSMRQVQALTHAYSHLGQRCGNAPVSVAVRSSAVGEDGAQASFAGQFETSLNVTGTDALLHAVQHCIESASSGRVSRYCQTQGIDRELPLAVLIQQFIPSDVSAVVFSADPRTGARDRVVINATWGLGESLVGGSVTPDLFVLSKTDLRLLEIQVADKQLMTIASQNGTREVAVPRALRREPSLSIEQASRLARLAIELESQQGWAVDLECVFLRDKLYLLQCRPITTL